MFGEYFFVEALHKALALLQEESTPRQVAPYPEDSLPAWAKQWRDGPTEEELPDPTEEPQANTIAEARNG